MFIVLEGCDGSGTTTQLHALANILPKWDISVISTAEPTNYLTGQLIRQYLKLSTPINARVLAHLFAADRYAHIENDITPALKSNQWVLCDRYVYSSIVYQGFLGGIPVDEVLEINRKILEPHIVFYLKVSAETAWERLCSRDSAKECFENKKSIESIVHYYDALKVVRNDKHKAYKFLSSPIYEIDGEQTKEEITDKIMQIIVRDTIKQTWLKANTQT